jgi:serine/threonine-protein kinase
MATIHIGRLLGPVGFARTVAVKRLHEHLAKDPDFVLMFIDEARIAARIHHPNVVQTIDVVSEGDELLLVMDYVPGESVSHLMRASVARQQRVPPSIAASIMSGALHGLHAAHDARGDDGQPLGVVHRDVSPQNILVGTDGVPRVLDFGVAKAVGRVQSTRSGTLKGKMSYMAPEVVRGADFDRRADIYAAAVVLWEVLVGRPMYRGEDEVQLMAKVLEGQRERPSSLVPGLEAFDDVVLRGLSMDPTQRFATAREMARALEACGPLAPPSDVGEWVESLAGERLAERQTVISRIESQTGIPMPRPANAQSEPTSQVSNVRPTPSAMDSKRLREVVAAMEAPPAQPGTVATGRALVFAGIAAVTGVVLAAIVALAIRPSAEAASSATPLSPSGAVAPSAPPSAASTEFGSETAAATASAVVPSIDIEQLAQVADPAAAPPKPKPQTHVVPVSAPAPAAAAAKPRAACDPPYTIDADGVKHYKRECN